MNGNLTVALQCLVLGLLAQSSCADTVSANQKWSTSSRASLPEVAFLPPGDLPPGDRLPSVVFVDLDNPELSFTKDILTSGEVQSRVIEVATEQEAHLQSAVEHFRTRRQFSPSPQKLFFR